MSRTQSSAINDLKSTKYPSATILLTFNFPLENHRAKADLENATIDHQLKDIKISQERIKLESKWQKLCAQNENKNKRIFSIKKRLDSGKEKWEKKKVLHKIGRVNARELLEGMKEYHSLLAEEQKAVAELEILKADLQEISQ